MLSDLDLFYLNQDEPNKDCFQLLRELILGYNENITNAWKYRMPFFCYKGKMFCYIWTHKKTQQPFIGFVEGKRMTHPMLTFEDRARIKIMLIDPEQDLPVKEIKLILKIAVDFVKADIE